MEQLQLNTYYIDKINEYYANDAKKLREVVNKIFYSKYGNVTDKDIDEFYGVATDILIEIVKKDSFNPDEGDFDGYFYRSVKFGIIDEYNRRHREKRCMKQYKVDRNGNKILDEKGKPIFVIVPDVRLDAPLNDDSGVTYGEIIASDFSIDDKIFNEEKTTKIEKYLNKLSKRQRKIVELLSVSYKAGEIQKILHITPREYSDAMKGIHSYKNISVLF